MDVSVDLSELESVTTGLNGLRNAVPGAVREALQNSAKTIQKEARKGVSTHPSWRKLAPTINVDLSSSRLLPQAVIGYDDVGQGELAGIAEFGSARHAPHPALIPAFDKEAPLFEKAVGDAVERMAAKYL